MTDKHTTPPLRGNSSPPPKSPKQKVNGAAKSASDLASVKSGKVKPIRSAPDNAALIAQRCGIEIGPRGGIKKNAGNLAKILDNWPEWEGAIARNVFSGKTVATKETPAGPAGEWSDDHDANLRIWFNENGFDKFSESEMICAVRSVSLRNAFHPLRDYLNGLEWDGIERVRSWLTTAFGAPSSSYTQQVGQCWLIGAVARAMRPGCKMDNMLVFQGMQGIGKSTAAMALAGEVNDWAAETLPDLRNKDALDHLQGKWIVEIAELDSMRGEKLSKVKAFLTTRVDRYRASYDRRAIDRPRTTVFWGTCNEDTFLTDTTGNRRFWPVTVSKKVDLEWLRAHRDQLWAEAVHLYRNGHHWWLDDDALAQEEQELRRSPHPWEEVIAKWLIDAESKYLHTNKAFECKFGNYRYTVIVTTDTDFNREDIPPSIVAEQILQLQPWQMSRFTEMTIGNCLRALGYERIRTRCGNRRNYRYRFNHLHQ